LKLEVILPKIKVFFGGPAFFRQSELHKSFQNAMIDWLKKAGPQTDTFVLDYVNKNGRT